MKTWRVVYVTGSYTDQYGVEIVRHDVADYITRRDGSQYPCNVDDIFMTTGSIDGIEVVCSRMSSYVSKFPDIILFYFISSSESEMQNNGEVSLMTWQTSQMPTIQSTQVWNSDKTSVVERSMKRFTRKSVKMCNVTTTCNLTFSGDVPVM